MKRFFTIILSLILVISTVGVSFSKHYCMGRLVEVTFGHEVHSCMDFMDPEMEDHCCDNDIEEFKVKDDFQYSSLSLDLSGKFYVAQTIEFQEEDDILPVTSSNTDQISSSFRPPGYPPVYIAVESFLL